MSLKAVAGPSAGQIRGTATTDAAAAGNVGEFLSSEVAQAAPVAVTTGVAKSITALVLTAGDWDVWGVIGTVPGSGTTTAGMQAAIGTVANTLPTPPNGGAYNIYNSSVPADAALSLPTGTQRVSTAGITLQLVTIIGFGVSTMSAYGGIYARRRR